MSDNEPILRYPFRFQNPITGKWHRAQWKASLADIESHKGEWIVDGPPAVYAALGSTSGFQQWKATPPSPPPSVDVPLHMHPQRDSPGLDEMERFLTGLFLRRYATYLVRRRRYAQAQGAAILARELGA